VHISGRMFDLLRRKLSSFAERVASNAPDHAKIDEKRDISPELGAKTKIKAIFSKDIKLREADIKDSVFELELALLEADVSESTAKKFCEEVKQALLRERIPADNIKGSVKEIIKKTLINLMRTEEIDLIATARASKKPFKILFQINAP